MVQSGEACFSQGISFRRLNMTATAAGQASTCGDFSSPFCFVWPSMSLSKLQDLSGWDFVWSDLGDWCGNGLKPCGNSVVVGRLIPSGIEAKDCIHCL